MNTEGQATLLSCGSNAGKVSNDKRDAKKSEMGTDQRTNPSPAQNLSAKDIRDHVKQSCGFSVNPEPREQTKHPGQAGHMNFVVWWFETNDFDGKTKRIYRDFETIRGARRFKRTKSDAKLNTINSQPWHHSHAYAPIHHFYP